MSPFGRPRSSQRRPPAPRQPQPNLLLVQFRKFQERRRLERLRPRPAAQPSLVQRAFVGSWRRFVLSRRQQRSAAPRWSLKAVLNPGGSEAISSRRAMVVSLRRASLVLIQLTLIPLFFNAIPVRLSGPEWYLQVINAMGESAPVWILAYLLGLASLALSDQDSESLAYHRRLSRSSRVLSLILVALVPLQIGFVVWLYGGAFETDRTQLNAIRSQTQALITAAEQQTSKEGFVAFLRSRSIAANPEAIEASPLTEVKSAFIQRVQLDRDRQEQALATATRSNLLRYSTNSLKLLATLVIFATFMLIMQGSVKRSLLHRIKLEAVESAQPDAARDASS